MTETVQALWVPAVFWTEGRERPIRRIVLHWMNTTLAGCDATFQAGVRRASAHYGLEGNVRHQYVHEADTAWHSGVRDINHESIGIEHSAAIGRLATEGTIQNSIDLCTRLCRRYGLSADAIDKHDDFYATQCPGTLPVSRIREEVRANLTGAPVERTMEEVMADLLVKNPITGELWSAEQALWSIWSYAIRGAADNVDEKALAQQLLPLISAPLKQAVLDALAASPDATVSPDVVAQAVVDKLAAKLGGA